MLKTDYIYNTYKRGPNTKRKSKRIDTESFSSPKIKNISDETFNKRNHQTRKTHT